MWSHLVNYVPWLQNLVRRSVMTMMTCTEVKGQQRSNVLILYMATTFDQIYRQYKVRIMMTFMKVIQRS